MLISLFKRHQHLISAWTITEFEKVGPNLRLQAQVTLAGGSVLFIRQVIDDIYNSRRVASRKNVTLHRICYYRHFPTRLGSSFTQRQDYGTPKRRGEGNLICRWDNAPHWPDIPSYPHHKHVASGNEILVQESHGGDLDEVFEEIATIMKAVD